MNVITGNGTQGVFVAGYSVLALVRLLQEIHFSSLAVVDVNSSTVQEFKHLKTIGSRTHFGTSLENFKKITSSQQQLIAAVGDGKTANDLAIVKAGVWVHVTRWNFFQLLKVGLDENAEPFFLLGKKRPF